MGVHLWHVGRVAQQEPEEGHERRGKSSRGRHMLVIYEALVSYTQAQ